MRLYILIIPLLFCHVAVARPVVAVNGDTLIHSPAGVLRGCISDADDGGALIGVNVYIPRLGVGATTDMDGCFEIRQLPPGELTMTITHIGYEGERREIRIAGQSATVLDVRLQPGIHEMGTVVVTGSSTPYLYTESPVKTEVITNALLCRSQSVNLADALSLQTGVTVDNSCQNCNFTQVRILGFDGKYAQVLIDGDPVVSSLAAVYALEHFPEEMIEQIEVVKGGGSALYGGGALSGTINMRTRYPLRTSTRFSYMAQSLKGSLDHKAGAVTEWVSDNADMGAYLYFSARNRSAYDHNNDGFTELGEIANNTVGVNAYLRPAGLGEFQLSLHHIGEERRGGSDLDLLLHEARISEWTKHGRWGGKLRWDHRLSSSLSLRAHYGVSLLDRDSYYGGLAGDSPEDRLDALSYYGFSENTTHVTGLRATWSAGLHDVTAGMEYSSDHLVDRSVRDAAYHIDALYTNIGLYAQDAMTLFDRGLTVITGARIDRHSELEDPVVSPRINARITLLDDVNLRLGYTTGFKAPQVFDEDLHIESLGGAQRVIRNVEGLQAERSRSFTAGIEYSAPVWRMPLLVGLTLFHTTLQDAFSNTEIELPGSDLILWQRINSDGGFVRGMEIDFGLRPTYDTELRLGATYKTARYDSPQEVFEGSMSDRFLRTPDFAGYMRLSHNLDDRISFFTSLRFTGIMTVPNATTQRLVETTDTFTEIDLGITYDFPIMQHVILNLNLGVKNLTDAYQKDLQSGIDRDPSYLYGPGQPRRYYVSMNLRF